MKHRFKRDEYGEVDYFAHEWHIHNGPRCLWCGDSWCMWCERGRHTEECPEGEAARRRLHRAKRSYITKIRRRRR
ncbi:hypothetical protein [Planomonospora sp. ID82291]|uniref:hypothetical protein n=1 Tax=Planomonospora sp. ID82291 TaxID=2738136 RepID=UPI0018C417F9|nr:hypothetical protein [Planomonospora sp. ID82291]MBG0818947.1 hypothetical protein [Planomonospora sp. ID82291]